MKRPFEIGDRVRVLSFPFRRIGEVVQIYDGSHGVLKIRLKRKSMEQVNVEYLDVFPEQCRLLKPPKPKPEKKEARRVWLGTDVESGKVGVSTFSYRMQNPGDKEFREVLPGEIVVTRETLAKAIQEYWQTPSDEPHTWAVCAREVAKALGLES